MSVSDMRTEASTPEPSVIPAMVQMAGLDAQQVCYDASEKRSHRISKAPDEECVPREYEPRVSAATQVGNDERDALLRMPWRMQHPDDRIPKLNRLTVIQWLEREKIMMLPPPRATRRHGTPAPSTRGPPHRDARP